MTFEAAEIVLRGGHGMHAGGDEVSSLCLEDLVRVRLLGQGATSRVYLCQHASWGTHIALKELTVMANTGTRRMAVNELRIAHQAQGRSKHLIAFVDAFFSDGNISIAMEYADAGSVADVMTSGGMSEGVVAALSAQMLQGLLYLHTQMRQLHRDLKPANVLLTRRGVCKLSDFGISIQLEATLAQASTQCGTTSYMSPERLQGDNYSYPSDVWSLGVIVLETLLGKSPFPHARNFFEQMSSICGGSPSLPPDSCSEALREFTGVCLQ